MKAFSLKTVESSAFRSAPTVVQMENAPDPKNALATKDTRCHLKESVKLSVVKAASMAIVCRRKSATARKDTRRRKATVRLFVQGTDLLNKKS